MKSLKDTDKRVVRVCIFITLLTMLMSSPSMGQDVCQVEESGRKVHMEQVKDHVGFCGPFAFRALLNEVLCNKSPDNCNLPSITHVIEKVRFNKPTQGEGKQEFFQKVLDDFSQSGIYAEKCVPFEKIFPNDNPSNVPLNWNQTYNLFFSRFINSYLAMSFDPKNKCYNKNYFSSHPIKPEQLSSFQFSEDIEKIMFVDVRDKIAKENKCKKQTIPSLSIKTTPTSATPGNQIKGMLKEGPLMVGLEIKQPGPGEIGPHAITITNYKTSCCFGVCETKYHILDSLGHYWASEDDDDWVLEKDLIKVLDQKELIQLQ